MIIGTLLLIYTFYRDKIFQNEAKEYFIYYCFCIGFIAFWLVTLFFNNNTKINVIISNISFAIGLLLIETILYALGYSNMTKLLHISVNDFDTRTALEVINDFKKDANINQNINNKIKDNSFINKELFLTIILLIPIRT